MKKVINIIIAALVLLCLATHVITLCNGVGAIPFIIVDVTIIALCILVLCYNFFLYKKPHGNILRYILLIYGFIIILNVFFMGKTELSGLLRIIAGTLIVYMSGRLNKIGQNKVLIIIILILFAAIAIMNVFRIDASFGMAQSAAAELPPADPSGPPEQVSVLSILWTFTDIVLWIALSLAYVSRFKAHKEAGLEDKPKA